MSKIDKKLLSMIREEIDSSFLESELEEFESFEKFFEHIDIQNAYEEEWTEENIEKYKPYYKIIWNSYQEKFKEKSL